MYSSSTNDSCNLLSSSLKCLCFAYHHFSGQLVQKRVPLSGFKHVLMTCQLLCEVSFLFWGCLTILNSSLAHYWSHSQIVSFTTVATRNDLLGFGAVPLHNCLSFFEKVPNYLQ